MKITKRQLRRIIRESTSVGRISSVARKAGRLLNEDQTAPKDWKARKGKYAEPTAEEKLEGFKKGDHLYAVLLQRVKASDGRTRLEAANDLVEEFKTRGVAAVQRITGQWAERHGLYEDEDRAIWDMIFSGMDWKKASATLVKAAEDVRDAIEDGFEGPVKVPT